MDQVKKHITRATELTAISVWRLIKEKSFTPNDILTEEESIKREKLIDQAGVDAMYAALTDIPFVLEVVGSEGRKHIHQYGEALPTLEGVFGSGTHKLDMVNNVVIMDRDRNAHYINAAQKFGVNLILIKAGDFMPSILSCVDPHTHKKGIHLVMGSGGFEEGVMAAVAGRALGGVCEGRGWSGNTEIQKRYNKVWSVDDLVSGKVEDCLVSISAITNENEWFDLDGVKGGHEVTTLTVDTNGINIHTKIHH